MVDLYSSVLLLNFKDQLGFETAGERRASCPLWVDAA